MTQSLPLAGLRVLDFGQYVAGPMTAAMLGDQGAEVIRIEPPDGPWWRSPAMETVNRRKKSIVLNLKQDEDLATARRLIATADVLIENFRPGVMDRLGLGPEQACALNPGLIYVAMPGFASTDQERRHLKAWEGVVAAESGQFTDMGLNRILMGINPSFSPLVLASAYASLFAATAIGAALYARLESGLGDAIEVPLASALMEGLVYNSMYLEDYPERYKSPREREADRRRAAREPLDLSFEDLQEFLDPFYRSYFCADGRPFYVVSASHVTHGQRTLAVLDLLDEAREAGIPELDDWYLSTSEWPEGVDCALGLYPLSRKWADWLSQRMKARFREKTSFEWEVLFDAAGVPGVAHRTTEEWLGSEHALASALVQQREDPARGTIRQVGPVAWLRGAAEHVATCEAPPAPGADREAILDMLDAQAPADKASRSQASGGARPGWLEGVKILDLTNVIAGPTIASTLARFGAEIVKLDPVKPSFDPWNTIIFGLQANRGKKSLLLDIKSGQGAAIYRRLIGWADLVTWNGLDRQREGLKLDPASLAEANPDAVLCQLDAFGGPCRGQRSDHPGYDDLAQAMTGVMARFGGSLDTPEEHAHLGTIDVLAGIAGAFASTVALFKKRRDGTADVARTSLAAAGQLLQAPFLYDFAGREPFDEPSGRETKGYDALYRHYEAADGHLFLAAQADQLASLAEAIGRECLEDLADEARAEILERTFLTQNVTHWCDRLAARGIGVGRINSLAALRQRYLEKAVDFDPAAAGSYHFSRFPNHPIGREVQIFAPCAVRPRHARVVAPGPAEKYGASSRAVLSQLGLEEAEIEALIGGGVVGLSWSRDYLPD